MRAMLTLLKKGAIVFDYGNNIRGEAVANGVKKAFDVQGSCRSTFARSFAKARARSGGRHFRAIPMIFTEPTAP